MAKIKPNPNGRYYNLELLVHKEKAFAVRIHGNLRAFSKTFVLHDLAGVFQYTLSQAQVEWLLALLTRLEPTS